MRPHFCVTTALAIAIAVTVNVTPPCHAAVKTPLSRAQILALLAGQVPSSRVTLLVQQDGIDFKSNDAFILEVRKGGGGDDLVAALESAHLPDNAGAPPSNVNEAAPPDAVQPQVASGPAPAGNANPAAGGEEGRQEALAHHTAQGGEFLRQEQYAQAETEYREALKLDPQNACLHIALSHDLNLEKKPDLALEEAHIAIALNPASDMAHFNLANSLLQQEDWAGAAAEYHETLRLNPTFDMAHNNLGLTLIKENNLDGAIMEFRAAAKISPNNWEVGTNLGDALEKDGDLKGAIEQFEKMAHRNPHLASAHYRLGQLFQKKGEFRRAQYQFRQAANLGPENPQFQDPYQRAFNHPE